MYVYMYALRIHTRVYIYVCVYACVGWIILNAQANDLASTYLLVCGLQVFI